MAPVAGVEDVPVDRMTAMGNMFTMHKSKDGGDRDAACDAYEEVLRRMRYKGGEGAAAEGHEGCPEERDEEVRRVLQDIGGRHGVDVDPRYGGHSAWEATMRALEKQVELEREGRRRR